MMNKQLNMEAFVGTGFDVEVSTLPFGLGVAIQIEECDVFDCDSGGYNTFGMDNQYHENVRIRPRLNDPQVLDEYDWVKEVDGAVWDVLFAGGYGKIELRNQTTENVLRSNLGDLTWLAYKGQQAGLGYDEWCKAHGVPILEVG